MVKTFLLNEVTYRTAPLGQYLVTTRRGVYTTAYVLQFSLGKCPVHLPAVLRFPSNTLHMSDQSFLWWDFEHAVHLQPSSSQLLSTGVVCALRLPLLPRREHHEGQADDQYQHTEAEQRDGYHQPRDSLFMGLFLQRHRWAEIVLY